MLPKFNRAVILDIVPIDRGDDIACFYQTLKRRIIDKVCNQVSCGVVIQVIAAFDRRVFHLLRRQSQIGKSIILAIFDIFKKMLDHRDRYQITDIL